MSPALAKVTVLNSASLPQHFKALSSAQDTLLHSQLSTKSPWQAKEI